MQIKKEIDKKVYDNVTASCTNEKGVDTTEEKDCKPENKMHT